MKKLNAYKLYLILGGMLMSSVSAADGVVVRTTSDGRLPYLESSSGFAFLPFYNAVLGKLLRLTEGYAFEHELLEKAYWNDEDQKYILKIREGLKFHNGREVDSKDLEFSLARFHFTTGRADQSAFLSNIKGITEIKRGSPYKSGAVPGLSIVDELTLSVELSTPNPSFLYSLTEGWLSLVPKEELEDDYVTWKKYPVGAGPYRVTSVDVDSGTVHLQRVKSEEGSPAKIEFTSSKDAKADVSVYESEKPTSDGKLEFAQGSVPYGYWGLVFNFSHPLARKKEFRSAISTLADRNELASLSNAFEPLHELLPSIFWGRTGAEIVRKPDAARAKLRELLAKEKKLKLFVDFEMDSAGKLEVQFIETIQKQLEESGISLEIVQKTDSVVHADAETPLSFLRVGTITLDALGRFAAYQKGGLYQNYIDQDDTELKRLFESAAQSGSMDVKTQRVLSLSKYFQSEYVMVPLVEVRAKQWFNRDRIVQPSRENEYSWYDPSRIKMRQEKEGN